MTDIELKHSEIKSELKVVGDKLREYAESSAKEIKNHAQLSAETKAAVDKLLTKEGELTARLSAAEQVIAKLETGASSHSAPLSMGDEIVSNDDFKAFAAKGKGTFTMGVKAAITSDNASNGSLVQPQRVPGIVAIPNQRLTIRDLLTWGRTASSNIEFVRETGFDNDADVVSENPSAGKPESDITTELDSAAVATIAHWIRASKQILSDMPMMASHINGRLQYGLKLKEETQLLKGSGSGLNIHGIHTQASAYSLPTGASVIGETIVDRLRLALLQVALAEYDADGIVLSPVDWANIELTKDANLGYLFQSAANMRAPTLWGKPIVATQSMDAGDFLVGSFTLGAQGWDREDMSVTVSTEDRDNFIKNMVTILCEERVALTVYRPEAFVKGDFTGLPASV